MRVYSCRGRCNTANARALLDELPGLHHGHMVGGVLDDADVVGDEEVGQAEVGSSQTISFGCTASARAMARRWRWPPRNSTGSPLPRAAILRAFITASRWP